MIRKASELSDQAIREQRRVKVEGRLIGDIGLASGRVLLVQVDADTEVEVGAS
jgi:hypothetical protein